MPGLGWVGFDPTNDLMAGARHIRTAVGRDYSDVPPTFGTMKGRAETELQVRVRVAPSQTLLPPDEDFAADEEWSLFLEDDEQAQQEYDQQQQQQQAPGPSLAGNAVGCGRCRSISVSTPAPRASARSSSTIDGGVAPRRLRGQPRLRRSVSRNTARVTACCRAPMPSVAVSSPVLWAAALEAMMARVAAGRRRQPHRRDLRIGPAARQRVPERQRHRGARRRSTRARPLAQQVEPMLSRPVSPIWMDSSTGRGVPRDCRGGRRRRHPGAAHRLARVRALHRAADPQVRDPRAGGLRRRRIGSIS